MSLLPLWFALLYASATLASRSVGGSVDLRRFKHLAYDTLYMGEHRHPRNASRTVHGYMFLHLDHTSAIAKAQRKLEQRSVSKALHFERVERHAVAGTTCSIPIADGASWKTSRGYFINAVNSQRLSEAFLERSVSRAFRRWNCALGDRLVIGPLLGVRADRDGSSINIDTPDGFNEIGLTRIDGKPGTIAFTLLFGVFSGPVEQRELTNFKTLFDQGHYQFGNSSETRGKIDFEATMTHEAGHVYGLDDIEDTRCADVTMYATSVPDETKKRTPEKQDIDGLNEIYA